MVTLTWLVAAAVLGGFVAGIVALTVGGLGVLLSLQRTVNDLGRRVESEVKRRAGETGVEAKRDIGSLVRRAAQETQALGPLKTLSDDLEERQRILRGGHS